MEKLISEFQNLIDGSKNIVFFGGAGVSTESGIPDFRSQDGLYSQKWKYPPETIISRSFFDSNLKDFYEFYREKLIIHGIEPNITHLKLAELEKTGKLKAVVTQNIDGLHQKAGSKAVYELHGSTLRNFCMNCGRFYGVEKIEASVGEKDGIPKCDCGGIIKPDVVLYEEGLDDEVITGAINAISQADLLIIGGTSLSVYPAAGLIRYFRGNKIVLVNKTETPQDNIADLVIHAGLGEVFSKITVNR